MKEITNKRYEELIDKELKLHALENGGVDNWEFYDESLAEYWNEKEKQEKIKKFSESICEVMCEYGDEPAGHGCGFGIRPEGQDEIETLITKFVNDYYKKE